MVQLDGGLKGYHEALNFDSQNMDLRTPSWAGVDCARDGSGGGGGAEEYYVVC